MLISKDAIVFVHRCVSLVKVHVTLSLQYMVWLSCNIAMNGRWGIDELYLFTTKETNQDVFLTVFQSSTRVQI